MIKVKFDEAEPRFSRAGQDIGTPFEIVDSPTSRACAYPHVIYAMPGEYAPGQGESWLVRGIYPEFGCFDEGGWEANRLGAWYYHKAMSILDVEDLHLRIECFRAAELFNLHAAAAGNVQSLINLGYVYSYDRCEGMCWPGWERYDAGDFSGYPVNERAFEVLQAAAAYDFAEAHYKLGDMYAAGKGCEKDDEQAFQCYARAYNLARNEEPVISGSCAYRLAVACEEARGCAQSFHEALFFYEEASELLGRAVAFGESYYKGVLRKSKMGERRMAQEISGEY